MQDYRVGGLDEEIDLVPSALPNLTIRPNYYPSRLHPRTDPRLHWSQKRGIGGGGGEGGAAGVGWVDDDVRYLSEQVILGELLKAAAGVCPPIAAATVLAQGAQFAGQAQSKDGDQYPVIGPLPDMPGVFLSTGFGGHTLAHTLALTHSYTRTRTRTHTRTHTHTHTHTRHSVFCASTGLCHSA